MAWHESLTAILRLMVVLVLPVPEHARRWYGRTDQRLPRQCDGWKKKTQESK